MRKAKLVKESLLKQLEAREKELRLLDEADKEKTTEVEKKEEIYEETEQKAIQAETCKRSGVKLLAEKGCEADSLTRPAKKSKTQSQDGADKDPGQIDVVDSEFHDFKKTMSSFVVGQIWAIYDPRDDMPRFYAKINRIFKSRLSLEVTWLRYRDEESVPVACGRFTYGSTETLSHLTFSHELQHVVRGRNFVTVNPKEGETWALFRDWSKASQEHHKAPYRYDLVEILGVGVSYLRKEMKL
ncbi:unnamed protein product [Thlaspi arvense]|uniref:DUF3444 domain-containing protein n=1 Tax=Thlaspi arvense TaxID=13288 RepID=A0AAU9SC68_THLAR|nr:unnamed protein product [Thlaspi arvense]